MFFHIKNIVVKINSVKAALCVA